MEFKKKLKITYLYLKRRVAKCRARLRPVIGRRRGERSGGVGCCAVAACVLVITRIMIFVSVEYLSQLPITELVTTTIQ